MSYQEVAGLIERYSGAKVLSAQTIWQLVQQSALQVSDEIERGVKQHIEPSSVELTQAIDLYDADAEEVLLFDDGISVKAQKPERGKPLTSRNKRPQPPTKVWGASPHGCCSAANCSGQFVCQCSNSRRWFSLLISPGGTSQKCNRFTLIALSPTLVVICDGQEPFVKWTQTFGKDVVVILDWYHLTQKLRNLMSMIVATKTDKQAHLKVLFTHLWQGQVGSYQLLAPEVTSQP